MGQIIQMKKEKCPAQFTLFKPHHEKWKGSGYKMCNQFVRETQKGNFNTSSLCYPKPIPMYPRTLTLLYIYMVLNGCANFFRCSSFKSLVMSCIKVSASEELAFC